MQLMKQLFCLFLVGVLVLSMNSVAFSTTINGAKTYGDYEYTINADNKSVEIVYFNGNSRKATTVPSEINGKAVTRIAWAAFGSHPTLEVVTISDGVITIADEAFLNCTKLQEASIGKGVKELPGNPFDGCIRLHTIEVSSQNEYLTVQDGVLYLKDGMKLRCYPASKSGSTYTIPDGVTEIGDSAFSGVSQLKTVVIPASVTSIHKDAFNNGYGQKQNIILDVTNNTYAKTYAIEKKLQYVDNGSTDTGISADPVEHTSGRYTYVLLEDGTAQITRYDEWEASPDKVDIPEKLDGHIVTSICLECGEFDRARSITIPDTVVSVIDNPFYSAPNLKTVKVSPNHPTLATIDGVLFNKEQKSLICYPRARTAKEYDIPQGIQIIEKQAFSGCLNLRNINIPDSVTTIEDKAFGYCSNLETVIVPDSIVTINGNPFIDTDLKEIIISPEHPSFRIVDGVLIDKNKNTIIVCLPQQSLTEYVIPENITTIEHGAFYDCESLENIIVPDSVSSIGRAAFYSCTSMKSIILPNGITSIKDYTFGWCEVLEDIIIPNSVTSIEEGAFTSCKSLKSIIIPHGITSIKDYTFGWCEVLEDITIPNSVTSIGKEAFNGCASLKSISIPSSVISIGTNAFKNCDSLSIIVESGSYAEEYCQKNNITYYYPTSLDWLLD